MTLVLLLLSLVCSQEANLSGEWTLQISTGAKSVSDTKEFEDETPDEKPDHLFFNLSAVEDGRLWGRISDENGLNLALSVSFSDPHSGDVFVQFVEKLEHSDSELSSEESTSEPCLLLHFQFTNRSNGFLISQGEFLGSKFIPAGQYYLAVTGVNSFVFTLFTKNSTIISVTGGKKPPPPEASFWSRMQLPLMMLGVMMLSRPKAQLPQPQAAPRQPPRAARHEEEKQD